MLLVCNCIRYRIVSVSRVSRGCQCYTCHSILESNKHLVNKYKVVLCYDTKYQAFKKSILVSKKWIFLVKIQNTEILSKNTGIQNIFLISNTKYRNTKYRNTKYSYIWRLSKNIKYIWRLSKISLYLEWKTKKY